MKCLTPLLFRPNTSLVFFGIVPAPNLDENGDVARLAEAMEKGGKKGENGKKPFGLVEIEGLGHD